MVLRGHVRWLKRMSNSVRRLANIASVAKATLQIYAIYGGTEVPPLQGNEFLGILLEALRCPLSQRKSWRKL